MVQKAKFVYRNNLFCSFIGAHLNQGNQKELVLPLHNVGCFKSFQALYDALLFANVYREILGAGELNHFLTYAVRVVGQVLGQVGLRIIRTNVLQFGGQAITQRMEVAAPEKKRSN